MIPSLLSISLIYGCIPSMAFIFLATSTSGCPSSSLLRILAVRAFWMFLMAAVLATAAALSSLASVESGVEGGLEVGNESGIGRSRGRPPHQRTRRCGGGGVFW